ncbi:hypothetical protein NliqN6_2356 [Naganishia liquefaciens]|uniref:Uncharacterized protein n=1 Tax=Naganishia liquefaciens TaxID=104408 RepID=A0A8H3TTI8_9TREE|nr:hypothetical protein NliqN6_2356 [Naganishia liquefaciens]
MTPATPLPHTGRPPATPHQPSTGTIPCSRHSTTGSITPDSVYSDVTHPEETPRKLLWTPRRTSSNEALGDTPRLPRTDRKRTRLKPTFEQGITAYPLTFASTQDSYTYGSPCQVTQLLDQEHARIKALPQAIFEELNARAYPLDGAAQRRITYLTEKLAAQCVARDEKHQGVVVVFPLHDEDSFARELKMRTGKLVERLERDARGLGRRRRVDVAREVPGVKRFTIDEQRVYEQVVQWKGRLPLHMGEYDAWVVEWGTRKEAEHKARTALGRGKGKRKRGSLVVDVPVMERTSTVVAEQDETDPHRSPVAEGPVIKKRRTAAAMRQRAQYSTTPTSTGSVVSTNIKPSVSAVVEPSMCSPGLGTNKMISKRERRGLGFTVSKHSMTSLCSSPDDKAGFEASTCLGADAGGRGGIEVEMSMGCTMGTSGVARAVAPIHHAHQDDTGDATFGTEAPRKRIANIASPRMEPSSAPVATTQQAHATNKAMTLGPEWHAKLKMLKMANIAARRNARAEPSEPSSGLSSAEIIREGDAQGVWKMAGEEGEDGSVDRGGKMAPRPEGVGVDATMGERLKCMTAIRAPADVSQSALSDAPADLTAADDQEAFPSFFFPNDLSTSTPKGDRCGVSAADDDETTTSMHSSPDRPFWQSESLPLHPPAARQEPDALPATQHDLLEDPPRVERPKLNGSSGDLMGMMDDLTACGRTTETRGHVWNVMDSPGAEGPWVMVGMSQGICRMGNGMMEETSDLLGRELVD